MTVDPLIGLLMANQSTCVLSADNSSGQERFYFSGWMSSVNDMATIGMSR